MGSGGSSAPGKGHFPYRSCGYQGRGLAGQCSGFLAGWHHVLYFNVRSGKPVRRQGSLSPWLVTHHPWRSSRQGWVCSDGCVRTTQTQPTASERRGFWLPPWRNLWPLTSAGDMAML